MKTAIVSGANGFIGSALVRELLAHDYKVYALGRENSCDNIPKDSRMAFIVCDLSDMRKLPEKLPKGSFDILYHIAWEGSAGPARGDTALQLKNAQWTVDTIYVAKELGCKRVVCAGSIMEHEAMAATYTQGMQPGMGTVYGGGKLAAHVMSMPVAAQVGIDLLWAEITNAYGPGEKSPRLVNTTMRKCLCGEAPEFTAGTQNYDFVYIDDVARAFRLIGENGKPFHEYTIGSSAARPLKDFLLEMQKAIVPDLPFKFGSMPFIGVSLPLAEFDCSDTERDTGFRAEIKFAEGCRRTMEWIKSQEAENEKI